MDRRRFLLTSAGAVGGLGLSALLPETANAAGRPSGFPGGGVAGSVAPTPDAVTGLELLQLPPGFRYWSFSWTGDVMTDGAPCPARHDGMGVVRGSARGGGAVTLIRNHELGPGPHIGTDLYDAAQLPGLGTAGGGTTRLRFGRGGWIDAAPALGGTLVNCAGGVTPWGSWLTCEEIAVDLTLLGGKRHGYVFEVPAAGAPSTEPLRDMGLFRHEAVTIDPRTGIAYETEDNSDASGLYRYLPDRPGDLAAGGTLEMLAVRGEPQADLRVPSEGMTVAIEWVTVPEPDALPERTSDGVFYDGPSGPFAQGHADGGARFRRGEGTWYHDGTIYWVDTTGGDAGQGAVWALDVDGETMTAVFVSSGAPEADNPDNITVSPSGGIVLCEDGSLDDDVGNRLLVLNRDGTTTVLAVNDVVLTDASGTGVGAGDYRGQEFAGATFDPSGRILFVNIQTPGITFAIEGPFARYGL